MLTVDDRIRRTGDGGTLARGNADDDIRPLTIRQPTADEGGASARTEAGIYRALAVVGDSVALGALRCRHTCARVCRSLRVNCDFSIVSLNACFLNAK